MNFSKLGVKDDFFKMLVDILNSKGVVLSDLKIIDLLLLGTRKKIKIFSGLTQERYYVSLFYITQKSRFLKKNAIEIFTLEKKLEELENHVYKNRILVISSPMCSKAKSYLKEEDWRIIEVKNDIL